MSRPMAGSPTLDFALDWRHAVVALDGWCNALILHPMAGAMLDFVPD
jgi:hypothetical protein